MFCMKCGKEMPEGANYCMFCGTPLGEIKQDNSDDKVFQSVECAKGFMRGILNLKKYGIEFVDKNGGITRYVFENVDSIRVENAIFYIKSKDMKKEDIYTITNPHTNPSEWLEKVISVRTGNYPG